QTTGVALVTVPAPEVVRAVADVQQPFEVDRADLAHHALGEQLPDPLMDRVVTVVERYRDVPAGACHGVQDLPAAGDVDGHRLLGDHVAARLQRGHDVLRMGAVDSGDQEGVDPLCGEHGAQLLGVPRTCWRGAERGE